MADSRPSKSRNRSMRVFSPATNAKGSPLLLSSAASSDDSLAHLPWSTNTADTTIRDPVPLLHSNQQPSRQSVAPPVPKVFHKKRSAIVSEIGRSPAWSYNEQNTPRRSFQCPSRPNTLASASPSINYSPNTSHGFSSTPPSARSTPLESHRSRRFGASFEPDKVHILNSSVSPTTTPPLMPSNPVVPSDSVESNLLTPESTPMMSYTCGSESDSSSYQFLCDFPQPPPLPRPIRRTKSSPLLHSVPSTDADASADWLQGPGKGNIKADAGLGLSHCPQVNRDTFRPNSQFPNGYKSMDGEVLMQLDVCDDEVQRWLMNSGPENQQDESVSLMLSSLNAIGPRQSRLLGSRAPIVISPPQKPHRHWRNASTPADGRAAALKSVASHDNMLRGSESRHATQPFPRMLRKMSSLGLGLKQDQKAPKIPAASSEPLIRKHTRSRSAFVSKRKTAQKATEARPERTAPTSTAPSAARPAYTNRDQARLSQHFESPSFRSYIDITPEKICSRKKKSILLRASQSLVSWGKNFKMIGRP